MISLILYCKSEPLSYEIFMWGDIGLVNDVRFLGVAPHWYFRPYMAWLIFCPHHYIGIFGLIFFYIIIYMQINIFKNNWDLSKNISIFNFNENSAFYKSQYLLFVLSMLYAGSYLPCGKFFTLLKGNLATGLSFLYIYVYLISNLDYYIFFFNKTHNSFSKKKFLKVFF